MPRETMDVTHAPRLLEMSSIISLNLMISHNSSLPMHLMPSHTIQLMPPHARLHHLMYGPHRKLNLSKKAMTAVKSLF